MAIPLKPGVSAAGASAEILAALGIAQNVYGAYGQPFTVTSVTEGAHMSGSKHYIGQAADLRTRDVDPSKIPQIAAGIQAELGPDYLVLREADHLHVQYNGIGTPADTFSPIPDAPAFDLSSILGDPASADGGPTLDASQLDLTTLAALGVGGLALYFIFG